MNGSVTDNAIVGCVVTLVLIFPVVGLVVLLAFPTLL